MKKIAFIILVVLSCCTSQKNVPGKSETNVVSTSVSTEPDVMKSATVVNTTTETPVSNARDKIAVKPSSSEKSNMDSKTKAKESEYENNMGNVPSCIKKLITQFKNEDVQNPPRKIYSYLYHGAVVYYVVPPCCDFFSDLYDKNCTLIAHPDGGITGKGDGKAKDFIKTRTHEKLIWEDSRK